jgi:ferredoxin-NADP reductase
MVRTELSALIGILFVLVAGLNVWLMFHRMSPAGSGARGAFWAQAHRAGGYVYVALYLVMMYLMIVRLQEASEELAPRALLHMLLGWTLAPLLFVKILIARGYKNQSQYLTPLGLILFCLSFVLVSITAAPYMLRRTRMESITLESVGFRKQRVDMRLGEELMRSRCARCHALDRVVGARKDGPGWLETVNRMRALPGSGISESEGRTIFLYLVKALGVDSSQPHGRELVQRALVDARCGRCHSLDTVYRARKSPDVWKLTIERMERYAPPGHFKPGEPEQILAYLSHRPVRAVASLASATGLGGGPGGGAGPKPPRPSRDRTLWLVIAGSTGLSWLLFRRGPGSRRPRSPAVGAGPAAPIPASGPEPAAAGEPGAAVAGTGRGRITLRLARIIPETPTTKTFRFLVPDDVTLAHRPGQFLTFDWMVDGQKIVRSYSISSSPSRSAHHVDITVKRVPDGRVSPHLHDRLEVGLTVSARPPAGRFVLADPPPERILCIAAGSGITPVMSILRWIDDAGLPVTATLLYSVRTEDEIIFRREIERLAETLPGFRAAITLTQPHPEWTGESGRLNREMLLRHCPELLEVTVYMCGPKPFMDATRGLLAECGVPPTRIQQELFGGPPAAAAPAVAATAAAGFRVEFSRSGKSGAIPAGCTLLEWAEMQGVSIPFSCRQGQCGTCATRLLAGEVRMDAEEGLDPELRRQGYVLTCVGRAQGDVTLEA